MFDNESLSHIGGNSYSIRLYSYATDDNKFDVLSAGYFNEEYLKLKVKDIIIVNNTDDVYTCKVTAVSKNSVTVEKTSLLAREYAHYYIPASEQIALNDDGVTYTQVTGMVATELHDFEVVGNTLVYVGIGGRFLFNGASNLLSNKVCEITVGLSINDVVSPQEASISFDNANKKHSVASTGIFSLATGDVLKVLIRGDGTSGIAPTILAMNLTFVEI